MDKETKKVVREATTHQQWTFEEGAKNYKLSPPDPSMSPVFISKTPSTQNSLKKVINQMQARGFQWPVKSKKERRAERESEKRSS